MQTGRYIGVMSGTSLDGIDVVLAAIDQNVVALQASYCHPMPLEDPSANFKYKPRAVGDVVTNRAARYAFRASF